MGGKSIQTKGTASAKALRGEWARLFQGEQWVQLKQNE